jgi:ABC-type transport system involved in Fe-S cluster assembly fused permease/ATPase subunit
MRGQHLGYVPQDVELAGTVAENICSFEPEANDAAIIAAAHAASVHEMILRLPQGYETEIGESGSVLSAGQSQRLALAPFRGLPALRHPPNELFLARDGGLALGNVPVGLREMPALLVRHCSLPSDCRLL